MAGDSLVISQTGLEGINTALQAVSNNLANVQTDGFKSESVDFETLLGSFVGQSGQIGGGVATTGVTRDFSAGAVVQSNNTTDMAIQGNGFFVLKDAQGNTGFTRDGQTSISSSGTLLGFNGTTIEGFGLAASGTSNGVLGPITIPQSLLAPTASTKLALSGNLDSTSPVISGAISITDPTTYNSTVSTQVYDSLGNSHVVTFYFQNSGTTAGPPAGELWNWMAAVDGSVTGVTNNTGSFTFDNTGTIVAGATPGSTLQFTPSGAAPLALNLNFSQTTQFAAPTAASGTADGNAVGRPLGVQIDANGFVNISYSNGQNIKVAQVAIATFPSLQGLQLAPTGVYQQTNGSGSPTIATAGAGSAGTIRPSALESSNVDTTSQLVQLVILQQNFQANAKALQAGDAVLATLTQMQLR